ncbi:MAG: hypothetical protein QOK36_964 [Gaiellales bacterium]|nr:hypothetical protein [Gaiellales bacterium]
MCVSSSVLRHARILLADDRPEQLDGVARTCRRLGHTVVGVKNGLAANVAIESGQRFDVAIVAVGMHSEHALDLIARLARSAHCPVLVLVDVEDPAVIRQAADRGVFAYLTAADFSGCGERLESTIEIARRRYFDARGREATPTPAHGRPWIEPGRRIEILERAEEIAGIGSYVWDIQTGELEWSDNLFRLFGLRPGAPTPTPAYVVEHTYGDDRDRVRSVVEAAAKSGKLGVLEYRITRADGSLRHLEAIVTSVEEQDGKPKRLVGTVQDVTERRQIAREMAGHIALEEVLATWVTLNEDATRLLAKLGEANGFSVGVLWLRHGDVLTARSVWNSGTDVAAPFDADTRRLESAPEQALAVAAWLSQAPVVVVSLADAPPFVGRDAALGAGLQGAVAFPAVSEGEVFAVLEFHSRETLQPTETLLRSLTGMGHELGHFFAHRRGELRPQELTAREREILQLTAQGMSVKSVAQHLSLSPLTIKSHFENIYAKWGVSDRASAVAKALREGLIR